MNPNFNTKKLFFFFTFLQTLLVGSVFSREWEPEALVNKTLKQDVIIDTNNYIDKSLEAYKNILNYAQEIQDLRKFSVYIYFIDSISSNYTSSYVFSVRKDIDRFVNDIAWHLVKGNVESDKNSLIILFSIEDRLNRIRTGENVRKYISDEKSLKYLKNLKSKMRSADYTAALEDLMYNVNWRITKDTSFYDFLENLFSYLIIFVICICCCVSCFSKEDDPYNRRDVIAESKLEKIKRISEKNKNNAKFVEDNCIICLEEFTEEEKAEFMKKKNEHEHEHERKENNNELKNEVDLGIVQNNSLGNNNNNYEHKKDINNGDQVNNNLIDLNYGKKDKYASDDVIRVNDVELGKIGNLIYNIFKE
jgi:hypothetical protein